MRRAARPTVRRNAPLQQEDLAGINALPVQLKERRPPDTLAREAPLTLAHLRTMQVAAERGR